MALRWECPHESRLEGSKDRGAKTMIYTLALNKGDCGERSIIMCQNWETTDGL